MDDKWHIGLTEKAIRQKVADTALSLLGIKEGTVEHKRIIDIYNAQRKLPRGYAMSYDDAWCAATMTYIGIILEISNIILPECSCSRMIELYKARFQWVEDDAHVPEPGDLVMYAWKGQRGENALAPDHVGMVVGVEGKSIKVVEGNYDNKVKLREIPIEYIKTRGFCKPDYAALVQPFADVDPGAWYAKDVAWAAEHGIVEGIGDGRFEPDRPITRAEAVALAIRVVELIGK